MKAKGTFLSYIASEKKTRKEQVKTKTTNRKGKIGSVKATTPELESIEA